MKFTEEQFNKLVGLQEKEYPNNVYSSSKSGYNNIDEALKKYDLELYRFVEENDLENQAVALMNPATRELAHEQFVEEEKKYVWTLKKVDKSGIKMRLYKEYFGRVRPFFSVKNANIDDNEKLTETEIKAWGYNPEMFDKEEVE